MTYHRRFPLAGLMTVVLMALVLTLSGSAADAADTIINLDAHVVANYGSPSAVVVSLAPGTYTVQPIAIRAGHLVFADSKVPTSSQFPHWVSWVTIVGTGTFTTPRLRHSATRYHRPLR